MKAAGSQTDTVSVTPFGVGLRRLPFPKVSHGTAVPRSTLGYRSFAPVGAKNVETPGKGEAFPHIRRQSRQADGEAASFASFLAQTTSQLSEGKPSNVQTLVTYPSALFFLISR